MPVSALASAAPLAVAAPSAPRASFGAALRAHALPTATPPTPALAAALARVDGARARLDAAISAARDGRTFTAGELLALQGDAYRFGELVEVASRAVEAGATAVRDAVHTQV